MNIPAPKKIEFVPNQHIGQIVSIHRTRLSKGYRFTGIISQPDGRYEVVVRKCATRAYTVAAWHYFKHSNGVGESSYLTFHQAAPKPQGSWDRIIRLFPIEEVA